MIEQRETIDGAFADPSGSGQVCSDFASGSETGRSHAVVVEDWQLEVVARRSGFRKFEIGHRDRLHEHPMTGDLKGSTHSPSRTRCGQSQEIRQLEISPIDKPGTQFVVNGEPSFHKAEPTPASSSNPALRCGPARPQIWCTWPPEDVPILSGEAACQRDTLCVGLLRLVSRLGTRIASSFGREHQPMKSVHAAPERSRNWTADGVQIT